MPAAEDVDMHAAVDCIPKRAKTDCSSVHYATAALWTLVERQNLENVTASIAQFSKGVFDALSL